MAKIKMQRRPSLKRFAQENDLDLTFVRQYQRLRKNWEDSKRNFARKYGGIKSSESYLDIRDLNFKGIPREEQNAYLAYRVENMAARNREAFEYLRRRQDTYIMNLYNVLSESPQYADNLEVERIWDWMTSGNATTEEKAQFIAATQGQGVNVFQYNEDDELVFDGTGVIQAVRDTLYKDGEKAPRGRIKTGRASTFTYVGENGETTVRVKPKRGKK